MPDLRKITYTIFLCTLFARSGFAQHIDTLNQEYLNVWYEKMDRQLAIRLSPNSSYETFRVETEPFPLILYPNIRTNFQFGFFHRWLAVYLNVAPRFLPGNSDLDLKGKTKYLRLRLALNFHRWENELVFSRVRGYYLRNTQDYFTWDKGDPYYQFPNLQNRGLYGSSTYYFNPKFSYRHLSTQTERQLKSAGSVAALFNFRYFFIEGLNSDLPGIRTQKSRNLEANLGFGYHHTFIIDKQFYVSMGFSPGLGIINTKLNNLPGSGDTGSTETNLSYRWDATGGIGYQGKSFFGGLYVDASRNAHRERNTTVLNSSTFIFYRFFIGWRIPAPKPLNDVMDWAERVYKPIFDKRSRK